jgi:hypothetical protein
MDRLTEFMLEKMDMSKEEVLKNIKDDVFDETVYKKIMEHVKKIDANEASISDYLDFELEDYFIERRIYVEIEGNIPKNKVLFFFDEKYKLYRRLYYNNVSKRFYYVRIEKKYRVKN